MSRLPTRSRMERPLSLFGAADRLLEDAFVRSPLEEEPGTPALDMYETENEVVVEATLPGIDPEDVEVTLTGDMLTIRGETEAEEEEKERNYIFRERRYGRFSRVIRLPEIDVEKVDAQFENGTLTVRLAKPEESKPKSIKVKAKD